jgi:hypothetical protein
MSTGLPGQDSGLSLGVRLFHVVRLWLATVLSEPTRSAGR